MTECDGCSGCGHIYSTGNTLFAWTGEAWLCRFCYKKAQYRPGGASAPRKTKGPLFEKPEEHEVTRGVLFCFSEHSGVKLNVSKFDDASGLDAYTVDGRGVEVKGRAYSRERINGLGGIFVEKRKADLLKSAGDGWFIYYDTTGTLAYPIPLAAILKGVKGKMDRTKNPRPGVDDKDDGYYVMVPPSPSFAWR